LDLLFGKLGVYICECYSCDKSNIVCYKWYLLNIEWMEMVNISSGVMVMRDEFGTQCEILIIYMSSCSIGKGRGTSFILKLALIIPRLGVWCNMMGKNLIRYIFL